MNKTEKHIYLKLKKSSWDNFFRVINNRKNPIEMIDNSSIGNFWASIQHLEEQFRENTDSLFNRLELIQQRYGNKVCIYCGRELVMYTYNGYGPKQEYCYECRMYNPNSYENVLKAMNFVFEQKKSMD